MSEVITRVTDQGLHLPRTLLEECGYAEGRRVVISRDRHGLLIQPAEATEEEIRRSALSYLLYRVGDRAGIGRPVCAEHRWRVPVVLMPEGQALGRLVFDARGNLLEEESDSPDALADAAERVDPIS